MGKFIFRNLLILFLCFFLSLPVLASRSMVRVKVKTAAGGKEEIGLYGESYALLVAASDYSGGWSRLHSVPREMNELEKLLKGKGFQVIRVDDPKAGELESAFKAFIDEYGFGTDNRLLFYYSGYGHTRLEGTKGILSQWTLRTRWITRRTFFARPCR